MEHLLVLVLSNLFLATFQPAFTEQFDDIGFNMGLCRRECLEVNTDGILRMYISNDVIHAQICHDPTKASINRAVRIIQYVTMEQIRDMHPIAEYATYLVWYACKRDVGNWIFDIEVCVIKE
ncbi:unnamed protein product [Onchocerca ochengi]|uniref:Venom protein n=1 Tax=Onchocerca ochengi TaxID=42157 RepID=A0A182ES61_ONCOC|nr:unnamed protein product [Onchocerca ochengi]